MTDVALEQVLARRAATLRVGAVEAEPDDLVEILVLPSGDERVALLVADAEAVIADVSVTPLPHLSAPWAGVVHLRGRLVAVVDLGLLLGRSASDISHAVILAGENSCALGVEAPPAAGRLRLGELASAARTGSALASAIRGVTADGTALVEADVVVELLRRDGASRDGQG